ncbi:MAG: single-stranded DNA-binding protein [Candidatus Omnitrophica bacterium]|jgi:single-strand DNA-binding protein|nr:single-stranded DNA-binding protein [Candidatus Omnitrophota bacterium]
MASLNKVLLIGNLTKDPELRYTPQGTAVANLRMAINRKYRDRNQEQKEEVCFITVVVWDKQAEVCNQYLQKGRSVFIEGRLQSRSWEDNTGQKKSVIEVRAERVQFLGGKPGEGKAPDAAAQQQAAPASSESTSEASWLEESEDNLNEG